MPIHSGVFGSPVATTQMTASAKLHRRSAVRFRWHIHGRVRPSGTSTDPWTTPKDVAVVDAAAHDDPAALETALAKGGKVDAIKSGNTALHLAAAGGMTELIPILLAAGAKVDAPTQSPLKLTPLDYAAMDGQAA